MWWLGGTHRSGGGTPDELLTPARSGPVRRSDGAATTWPVSNIKGGCGLPFEGQGVIHLLVDDPDGAIAALAGVGIEAHSSVTVLQKKFQDRPGELGELTRRMGDAGINVYMFYLSADGEIVLGVNDIEKARALN